MSTIVDKDSVARSSSFVETGGDSNLSTGSSHDEYDDDAIDYKPNLVVSRAAAAQSAVAAAAAARFTSHVNNIARVKEHYTTTALNMGGLTIPHHHHPVQLYKSLFANAVLQNPDKMCSHPFPRNLLFSYSEKSPNSSDFEADDKSVVAATATDEVCFMYFLIHSNRLHSMISILHSPLNRQQIHWPNRN